MSDDLARVIELLREARQKTPYNALRKGMTLAGCTVKDTAEGCQFYHPKVPGRLVNVPKPHGKAAGNVVKKPYVMECVKLLEAIPEE